MCASLRAASTTCIVLKSDRPALIQSLYKLYSTTYIIAVLSIVKDMMSHEEGALTTRTHSYWIDADAQRGRWRRSKESTAGWQVLDVSSNKRKGLRDGRGMQTSRGVDKLVAHTV